MLSMSYGYELLMTPLYTLNAYNAIANDGYYVKPHVVRELRRGGEVVRSFDPEVSRTRMASKKNIELIQSYLLGVVERPDGTACSICNDDVRIAGKTGTAEMYSEIDGRPCNMVTFVGYFPADEPQYTALVLMVGNYGEGNGAPRTCATVVRDIARFLMVNY